MMTIIHARFIGDKALLTRKELEKLLQIAQRNEKVELKMQDNDLATLEIMQLAEKSGAFDFWKENGENIYSVEDGEDI